MNKTLAQGFTNPVVGDTLKAFESANYSYFLNFFIPRFVGLVFVFGALAFFFMLVWGAISYILSGGDKAHIESARGRITNALVGFVLLIGSFALIGFIETFFGIKILSIDIGPLVIQ